MVFPLTNMISSGSEIAVAFQWLFCKIECLFFFFFSILQFIFLLVKIEQDFT